MRTDHIQNAEMQPIRPAAGETPETEFRRLLDKLPAGAYMCDRDGLITYFNQIAASKWGRSPKIRDPQDRFCGSHRLFAIDGKPVRHDQCWMALALQTNQEYNGREIVVERPDGNRLTVMAYASPIHDASGQVVGGVNVIVDITERKLAEEKLLADDRAKDEFLATLAHELRNPLAPLRNAAHVLRMQQPVSPHAQWALEVIERQTQQMTRLIDDLLDVSRITTNNLELRTQRVEFGEIVRAALETSRPLIEAKGLELTISLPANPLHLNADLTRLSQALANLLNNAAKYTDRSGHVWLSARRDKNDIVVSVRDSGLGIPVEMLPHVFDMFTQVSRTLNRSQGGLGIGLSLVKRLVELHGGTVEVKSDGNGKGSEFIMRLPLLIESNEQSPSRNVDRPRFSPQRSLKILIADDNHDSADSLAMLLRMTGHEVRVVYNGIEAVATASTYSPDVALLDIGMPELSGYQAARQIREQGRAITLLALTGWGQDSDRQRSREAGFDQHIVKPVNPAELLTFLAGLQHNLAGNNSASS